TTLGASCVQKSSPVHPHVRGDDVVVSLALLDACGSPPRAWGRRAAERAGDRGGRFTPTCVGTTPSAPPGASRRTVHPHVRGDDRVRDNGYAERRGSPPRAWGRHDELPAAVD